MTQKVDQAIARSVELGGTVVMIPHATKEDLDYARSIRTEGWSDHGIGLYSNWGVDANGSGWGIGLVAGDPLDILSQIESLTRERDRLREALIEAGRAAGAVLANNVSTDFLVDNVANEVRAKVRSVRGEP